MVRSKTALVPTTPQAKLAGIIKSARDTMRKDAGLNGDLDRIPQLTWLVFLKAFDGLEQSREITDSGKFRPSIEEPYRWRDWAGDRDGPTGDALLAFVNWRLLPYLRGLSGTGAHDPRDVLAAVFKETNNRMLSGYLLRDVVNKVNEIIFTSSDDIHTMSHVYESMLREVRDAAGDSGEFYTPRPVIRFMVKQVDPKLGEIVLDPACGTGGFLVETLQHVAPQVETTQQRRALHNNLRGYREEASAVPARDDESRSPRRRATKHHASQRAVEADHSDRQGTARRRRAYEPTVRWRRRGKHPGELPGRQADRGDSVAIPSARHPPTQGRRTMRHRRPPQRALRRRCRWPHQRPAADRM